MRNLKLIYKRSHQYDDIKARLMVQHVFENISYIYDENNAILKIDHDSGVIEELCKYEDVIALEYIQINDCLCFATKSGYIVQYNFITNHHEIVSFKFQRFFVNKGINLSIFTGRKNR